MPTVKDVVGRHTFVGSAKCSACARRVLNLIYLRIYSKCNRVKSVNEGTMIESEETDIEEITVWVCMNNNRFVKRVIVVIYSLNIYRSLINHNGTLLIKLHNLSLNFKSN